MHTNLVKLMAKQETRIALCEKSLALFALYHFTNAFNSPCSDFHKQWFKDLLSNKHLLLIWFRESWKTLLATIKIIHSIVYKKNRFLMVYSYDKRKSTSRLYDIVVQLQTNKKLINDFWQLFPEWRQSEDESQKRSIPDFITKNWVKVKASSIWESPRWEMYLAKDWSFRPDLILLDDIDVEKSVQNIDIIDKNYSWIKSELFWWVSQDCKIIFLWNIIKSDWVTLRLEKDFLNSEEWIIRRQALIDNWNITWNRFTEEDIEKRKALLWTISFNQNYLLIPYSWWDSIIKRHQIKWFNEFLNFDFIIIWIDPAISENNRSDSFAISMCWILWDSYYFIECLELKWEDKDPFKATNIVLWLYNKYKARYVIIETIAFQQVMSKLFKQAWIATKEVKPHKDKISRLLEHQYLFEQWKVNFSDKCSNLVEQLLMFPNDKHDDMVDSMIFCFTKRKWWFMIVDMN